MKINTARPALLPALKIAVGAALSTLLAGLLGLSSPMTAGIITVLSIRSTQRETWRMSLERLLGFLCALACAWLAFAALGYTLTGFAAYLFAYAVICITAKWEHALTPVSVLVTHFVLAGGMPRQLIVNEALLLLIGSCMGLLINLTLRPDTLRMSILTEAMDRHMVAALRALADTPDSTAPFDELAHALSDAAAQADRNAANRILGTHGDARAYVQARQSQYEVLLQMRRAMNAIDTHPPQYDQVCSLLHAVADQYSYENDVQALLDRRAALLEEMRRQPLPTDRREFESRAVLYTVLLRLEDFLRIKRAYHESLHPSTP